MFSRISSVWLCAMLAACGGGQDGAPPIVDGPRVACALQGAAAFTESCFLSQAVTARGTVLTISAPDGGFRRLLVTDDGEGIVAADGAEPAIVKPVSAGLIEVSVGGDRYRLPARTK